MTVAWQCELLWPVRHEQTSCKQVVVHGGLPSCCTCNPEDIVRMNQSYPARESTRRKNKIPQTTSSQTSEMWVGHLSRGQTSSPDHNHHLPDLQNHKLDNTAFVFKPLKYGIICYTANTNWYNQAVFICIFCPFLIDGFWQWLGVLSTSKKINK